jgi:hypothetical protein
LKAFNTGEKKLSPLYFFYSYILISYLWSLYSIYTNTHVSFNYHLNFTVEEVIAYSYIPFSQILFIWIGSVISYKTRFYFIQFKIIKIKWYSSHLYLSCIMLFFIFCLIQVSDININTTGEIKRYLEFKGSHFLLLLVTLLALINFEKRRFYKISFLFVILTAILYAVIDGSRAALLPFIFAIFFSLIRKNKKLFFYSSFFIICILVLIATGRVMSRQYSRDLIDLYLLIEATSNLNLSYFFSFSYLHLFTVNNEFQSGFSFKDFLYSITPIPSSLIPYSPDTSNWRLDVYRPIGAQGSLLYQSLFLFNFFHLILGFIGERIKYIKGNIIASAVFILLALTFVVSFQYNLRSIQWYLWFAIIILIFSKKINRRKVLR